MPSTSRGTSSFDWDGPAWLGQDGRDDAVVDHGPGAAHTPELFCRHREIEEPAALAAELLGKVDPEGPLGREVRTRTEGARRCPCVQRTPG